MSTQTTPDGPKDELSGSDVSLLNRLFGDDPNFAMWRSQAGFSPTDLVRNLGDYLAQLSARSQSSQLLGFQSFLAPAPALAASDAVSDEFNATTLDPSWARFHTLLPAEPARGAAFTAANSARESISGQRPGWYLGQPATDGGLCGLHKGVSDMLTSLGVYYTRFSMDSNAATPASGDQFFLMASQTLSSTIDPDNYVMVKLLRDTTAHTWTLSMQSEVGGAGAVVAYSQALTSFAQPVDQLALVSVAAEDHVRWLGFAGTSGGCWKYLGELDDGDFEPNRLALSYGISSNSSPCPVFGLDYVRREVGAYPTK